MQIYFESESHRAKIIIKKDHAAAQRENENVRVRKA